MITLILSWRLITGEVAYAEIPAVFDNMPECVAATRLWFDVPASGGTMTAAACVRIDGDSPHQTTRSVKWTR